MKAAGGEAGRWRDAACCCFFHFSLFGLYRSSGVLFAAVLLEGQADRAEAAWPFALCAATFQLSAPLATVCCGLMSERSTCFLGCAVAALGMAGCFFNSDLLTLNLCFGIVHGLGFGVVIALVPVILGRRFGPREIATAIGLAFSGGTVGSLVFPRGLEFLVDLYGLRGTLLLASGLVMNGLVAAALLGPSPLQPPPLLAAKREGDEVAPEVKVLMEIPAAQLAKQQTKSDEDACVPEPTFQNTDSLLSNQSQTANGQANPAVQERAIGLSDVACVLRDPAFHLISVTMAVFFLGVHSFFMVIVDFARDKGISETDSSYVMAVFSAADLVGRAGLGWLTDRTPLRRRHLVALDLTAIALLNHLYPLAPSLPWMLATAVPHGLAVGSCLPLFFVLQLEYMGARRQTLVVGLTSFINGLLAFVRPPITGLFRDVIGSYDWMFHFLGSIAFVMALLWIVEPWLFRAIRSPSHLPEKHQVC